MVAAGIITTVAGNGTSGSTGDGGPATSAEIYAPQAIAFGGIALVSILVTPSDPTVAPGGTQQFTATGSYSDGSFQNLTSTATWSSSVPLIATITAAGLATGALGGITSISATSAGVTGSTLLTVNAAPSGPSISERSFACNGCFESTSAYGDVLKSLALSMAGFVVPPGDCWRIYAGAYVPPTVVLQDPDCRGAIKADIRLSARDTCNGVKGQYIPGFLPINPLGPLAASPASPAWKKTDFPPVQRANYIEEDGGIILWKDIQLDFTISLWMAQRIARIILERLRRQVTVSLPAKLTGIALLAADTMQFLHPRWGSIVPPAPEIFQVSHTALRMESQADGVPAFGTDLVLRETDADVFEFAPPTSPTSFGDYSPYGQTGIGAGNVE
jgi:Bacterial Ig-like domain (group 2)